MAAIVKTKLKASREAISKKDYAAALRAAEEALTYDASNYHGNVFAGRSAFELGEIQKSEQAYRKAIDLQPDQLLAWQGIAQVQEATQRWDELDETLEREIEISANSGEATKVAEFLQKLIATRRDHGTVTELVNALSLLLPGSRLYDVLSTIPPPEPTAPTKTTIHSIQAAIANSLPTLEEIVSLVERSEEDGYAKEVERRRTRLNAGTQREVQNEVGRDIWGASKLPGWYEAILNHPNTSDDLRRKTESKLLRHRQRYLYSLPTTSEYTAEKNEAYKIVEDMASGAVLLGIADELAWSCYMENLDVYDIEGYDFGVFRRFTKLFPGTPLANLLGAYLQHLSVPVDDGESEAASETVVVHEADSSYDPVDVILTSLAKLAHSIIAHRIAGEIYTADSDYKNAIRVAEAGLSLVKRAENNNGKMLHMVRKAFDVILATGLVHLHPPKHHARASRILDDVLARDPGHVSGLMARAYICQYAKNWEGAVKRFQRVLDETANDESPGWTRARAREEIAWCSTMAGEYETSAKELKEVAEMLEAGEAPLDDRARVEWRLGKCMWQLGGKRRDESYRHFIRTLKHNSTYAPAFTSLGVYYSEHANPPDLVRASKCFEKAFELDAREGDAARRLAEGFADEREWDLVEVIARRTIEGEGGLTGGLEEQPVEVSRHEPIHGWAWKAIGLVELNRHSHSAAVQAFQVGLRSNEDDWRSWLQLGEAYAQAGRHSASLKALERARALAPSSEWISAYTIGIVQRDMGLYSQAVDTLRQVVADHGEENDALVLVALAGAHLDLGCLEAQTGYNARAEVSWCSSLGLTYRLVSDVPLQPARRIGWKLAYDVLLELGRRRTFLDTEAVQAVLAPFAELLAERESQYRHQLAGAFEVGDVIDTVVDSPNGGTALKMAAMVSAYSVTLSSDDEDVAANAWAGVAIALCNAKPFESSDESRKKLDWAAVNAVKHALRRDASSDGLWSLYGSLMFGTDAKVAQHAYIKAIETNKNFADHWARLGLLYLNNEDTELARHVLTRAQTLDPETSLTWVGQSLLAAREKKYEEAQVLLEHAVSLTSYAPRADKEYATERFTNLTNASAYEQLFSAFFSMQRYCQHFSDDASGLHLLALIAERLGMISLAVDLSNQAIGILESIYEKTEDLVIAEHYGIAKTNLGRLYLSERQFSPALDSLSTALLLLPEDAESETIRTCRAHALANSGIAYYMQDSLEKAIEQFELAVASAPIGSKVRGNVVIALCQALWEAGLQDTREAAKAQLLEIFEQDPSNLECIVTLVAIGTLNDDADLVDAALSEILAMPVDQRQSLDPTRQVDHILVQHHLAQGRVDEALKVVRQTVQSTAIPGAARKDLSRLLIQQGNEKTLENPVVTDLDISNRDELSSVLRTASVAKAKFANSDVSVQKDAERALVLEPWNVQNTLVLAYVRSRLAKSSEILNK